MAGAYLNGVLHYLRRTVRAVDNGATTDRALLARFAASREQAAFALLIQRHAAMVLSVCRRVLHNDHDAEEAFQAAFLVLATKAGAIGWHESVAAWLHAVAFRVASNLRAGAARRQHHERQSTPMHAVDPLPDVETRDLRRVLDDELSHLPEKYRAPLVLCYLEGKTNEEAAVQLGWTKGTVSGRLAKARDLLRDRLVRRGLTLSAAALPVVLTETKAPASAALLHATIQAAALGSIHQALAVGAVSRSVASLAEGVLQNMFLTKLKWITASLLLVLVGTSAGIFAYQRMEGSTLAHADDTAPLPTTEIQRPLEPGASRPVVKEGLSVTVRPAKAVFAPNEPLVFDVSLKNVGDKTFLLCMPNDFVRWTWEVEETSSRVVWQLRLRGDPDLDKPHVLELAGSGQQWLDQADLGAARLEYGKVHTVRARFADNRFFSGPKNADDAAAYRERLKPGKYRVRVALRFGTFESHVVAKSSWIGDLTTGTADFAIADPAANAPVNR